MKRKIFAALLPMVLMAVPHQGRAAYIEITIAKMKFVAPPGTIHPGDVVVWRNNDIFRHTATARDGSFDVDLPPKAEVRMTVGKEGNFDFYCRFHPAMKGKLEVKALAATGN